MSTSKNNNLYNRITNLNYKMNSLYNRFAKPVKAVLSAQIDYINQKVNLNLLIEELIEKSSEQFAQIFTSNLKSMAQKDQKNKEEYKKFIQLEKNMRTSFITKSESITAKLSKSIEYLSMFASITNPLLGFVGSIASVVLNYAEKRLAKEEEDIHKINFFSKKKFNAITSFLALQEVGNLGELNFNFLDHLKEIDRINNLEEANGPTLSGFLKESLSRKQVFLQKNLYFAVNMFKKYFDATIKKNQTKIKEYQSRKQELESQFKTENDDHKRKKISQDIAQLNEKLRSLQGKTKLLNNIKIKFNKYSKEQNKRNNSNYEGKSNYTKMFRFFTLFQGIQKGNKELKERYSRNLNSKNDKQLNFLLDELMGTTLTEFYEKHKDIHKGEFNSLKEQLKLSMDVMAQYNVPTYERLHLLTAIRLKGNIKDPKEEDKWFKILLGIAVSLNVSLKNISKYIKPEFFQQKNYSDSGKIDIYEWMLNIKKSLKVQIDREKQKKYNEFKNQKVNIQDYKFLSEHVFATWKTLGKGDFDKEKRKRRIEELKNMNLKLLEMITKKKNQLKELQALQKSKLNIKAPRKVFDSKDKRTAIAKN